MIKKRLFKEQIPGQTNAWTCGWKYWGLWWIFCSQYKLSCTILFSSLALNLTAQWGIIFVRDTRSSCTTTLFEIVCRSLYWSQISWKRLHSIFKINCTVTILLSSISEAYIRIQTCLTVIRCCWEFSFRAKLRMSNNVNIFSILTLVAIFIVFIAQILALSTDYWSETEVLDSTKTVNVILNFWQA